MGEVTGVRLRPMTTADVRAVMDLEHALFPLDAWEEELLRAELAEPTRFYLVAESGESVVGYAGLRAEPPEGDVQTMAVAEPVWGHGVGRSLLARLLDEAGRRNVTHVFLEVRSDNPRAQELYRRFDFVQVGVRRDYYEGADAIVMRRAMRPGEGTHE